MFFAVAEDKGFSRQAFIAPSPDGLCGNAKTFCEVVDAVNFFVLFGGDEDKLAAECSDENPEVVCQLVAFDEFFGADGSEPVLCNAETYKLEWVVLFRLYDLQEGFCGF